MEEENYNILLNHFKTNIRFKELCVYLLSRFYPFTKDQIINYHDILDLSYSGLMNNNSLIWDLSLIELLKDDMDWSGLWKINGLELDLSFFKTYKERIDFKNIHLNKNIDWSNELLDTYQDKWDWEGLSSHKILAKQRNINKYTEKLDWRKLSKNSYLELNETVIDDYVDYWNWNKLCSNSTFKLDKISISKYSDLIDWSALSKNPSMVPFILAHTSNFPWKWQTFVRNSGLIWSDKILEFLVSKLKKEYDRFKQADDKLKRHWAISEIIRLQCLSMKFDSSYFLDKKFESIIPFKIIIKHRSKYLSTDVVEKYLDLNDYERILPLGLVKKLSKKYIEKNYESLEKFSWKVFRYGNIDEEFVMNKAQQKDWFQLAFNEKFVWSLNFLISNLNRFESNYGLSQNKRIYDELFGDLNNNMVDSILKEY